MWLGVLGNPTETYLFYARKFILNNRINALQRRGMRIATMVRGYLHSPRPSDIVYAPIDLAVALSEKLVERGHVVDYYGPNGTQMCAGVRTLNLRALAHNQKELGALFGNAEQMNHNYLGMWDAYLARDMFQRAHEGEYDLLHFHHTEIAIPFVGQYPDVPVIYTLHDPIFNWQREVLEMYQTQSQFFVSISKNQRVPAPDLPYIDTVYNGIDTNLFEFSEEHDDFLLAAGRIVPEKGIREAIQAAQATNNRLLIIGPVYPDSQEYFDQYIKPHLNEKILYLGFVEREQMVRYYQKAKALLMPVQWEEPFGLTMTEAMACGTPVIAFRRGSIPEVIVDGKTGFIVDSVADMALAIKKLDKIKAKNCRKLVEDKFSIDKMVDGYEAAYQKTLELFAETRTCPPMK